MTKSQVERYQCKGGSFDRDVPASAEAPRPDLVDDTITFQVGRFYEYKWLQRSPLEWPEEHTSMCSFTANKL